MGLLDAEKISVAEASKLSGIARFTLYDLFEEGEIEGYQCKPKSKIFILKHSLEDYLRRISNINDIESFEED